MVEEIKAVIEKHKDHIPVKVMAELLLSMYLVKAVRILH